MKLEDLNVYSASMDLADEIWNLVEKWDYFTRDTIGKQLIRAVDSIAANISEGHGRFHYRDKVNFIYFSRGSLFESKTWITKAYQRDLIDNEVYSKILNSMEALGVKLNNFIHCIKSGK